MPGLKTNEREGTRAVLRHARVSPSKVREVLDLVRDRPVHEAEDILRFSERDVAFLVGKLLHSAVANAQTNDGMDPEELYVATAYADEGTTIKRWRPRARGRATRIRKRTSHITVIVARLPEDRLARLSARRRSEQLAQRSRRVAGARRAGGDPRTRAQRRRNEPIDAPVDEAEIPSAALVAADADEADIVDETADAIAAADGGGTTETAADRKVAAEHGATEAGRMGAAEEEAGIVDTTAGAVAAERSSDPALGGGDSGGTGEGPSTETSKDGK